MYDGWFVGEWPRQGCWYLWLLFCFFSAIMAGFGTYREDYTWLAIGLFSCFPRSGNISTSKNVTTPDVETLGCCGGRKSSKLRSRKMRPKKSNPNWTFALHLQNTYFNKPAVPQLSSARNHRLPPSECSRPIGSPSHGSLFKLRVVLPSAPVELYVFR